MRIPRFAIPALALTFAACAPGSLASYGVPEPAEAGYVVTVTNHNWADVNVYAVVFGARQRLGTVHSMTTRRLRLRRGVAGWTADFVLMVDPIGSARTFVSEPIQITAGQTVDFTVENHLAVSSYQVR